MFTRIGRIVFVDLAGNINMGSDGWSSVTLGTLPEGFRPVFEINISLTVQVTNAPVALRIQADGTVFTRAFGGAAPGSNWVFGNGSYIAA